MTRAAWEAYGEAEALRDRGDIPAAKQQYARAMGLADECAREFVGRARETQKALEADKLSLPKEGKIHDPAERQRLFDRGPLNDATSCLWLQGRCLARLGRADEARKVYEIAMQLTYAACWDEDQDLFWSSSLKARDDLEMLEAWSLK